jgi:hypothetical protein
MYVPFENLPEESKIWVYQSNRKFSDTEFSEIESALQAFLEVGSNKFSFLLSAKIQQVYYTGSRSGCAVCNRLFNRCIRWVYQSLEQKYKVDLLDKMNI